MKLPRLRVSKKHFILFEIGVAVVLFILFIGLLNSVVYTSRVPLVTSADVYNANETVLITYTNSTSGALVTVAYSLQSIAVLSGDKLYIQIPPRAGYDNVWMAQICLNRTLGDLAQSGLNYVELYIQGDIVPPNINHTGFVGIAPQSAYSDTAPYRISNYLVEPIIGTTWSDVMNALGNVTNKTIDATLFTLKALAWGKDQEATLFIGGPRYNVTGFKASYIVIDFKLYAVSEKPVLRAMLEPIYSFFAAVYAVLLAVIKKVKEYVVSAFGGFASQFTLTGLIGDPVTALILTMVFITIIFLVIKKR